MNVIKKYRYKILWLTITLITFRKGQRKNHPTSTNKKISLFSIAKISLSIYHINSHLPVNISTAIIILPYPIPPTLSKSHPLTWTKPYPTTRQLTRKPSLRTLNTFCLVQKTTFLIHPIILKTLPIWAEAEESPPSTHQQKEGKALTPPPSEKVLELKSLIQNNSTKKWKTLTKTSNF